MTNRARGRKALRAALDYQNKKLKKFFLLALYTFIMYIRGSFVPRCDQPSQENVFFLHFFSNKFGHIKKKQYLCTVNEINEIIYAVIKGYLAATIIDLLALLIIAFTILLFFKWLKNK